MSADLFNHLTPDVLILLLIAGATTKTSPITTPTVSSRATLNVSFPTFQRFPAQIAITGTPCLFVCCEASILFFRSSAVGGWFIPGQAPICPSSSPPQFSSTAGHSSGSYCERYSSLRSHRAAPYPSHYSHRTSSTSRELDAPRIDDTGQQLR